MANVSYPTLLMTGGAGFIGSCFVRQQVALGRKVIVLDAMTYAGHPESLEGITGPGSFELIKGDICDAKLVPSLLKKYEVDAVLNFAAESHVDRSISGPADFIQTNIFGVFNLLQASVDYWNSLSGTKKEKFRYLQVSTDEVYGSLGPTGYFSETTAYAPNSPYSSSKASGDLLTRAWHHTYGLPTITTNCSNNYGPRQFPEKLIPLMITHALEGKPLPVYGDGGNIRDWIHVEDHCRGVWLALEKGIPGQTYCFGGRAEKNNLDVVNAICNELDHIKPRADKKPHKTAIQFVKDRLGHDRRYAIDDTLAQNELGFTREYNFEKGLKATIHWYLENSKWCQDVLKGAHGK
jgi:dTDP-glucose 4,6-dehydratase